MCSLRCYFQPGCELTIFPSSKRARLFSIWRLGMSSVWSTGNLVSWKDKFCLQTVSAKDDSSKYCSAIRLLSAGKTRSLWMRFAELKDIACGVSLKYSRLLKRRGQIFSHLWMKVNGSKKKVREMWKRNHTGKSLTTGQPEHRADQSTAVSQALCLLCVKIDTAVSLYTLFLTHTLKCILKEL